MKNILFFIRCRDKLDAAPEEMIILYGEAHEFEFFSSLCRLLTVMFPKSLVEFGHYSYSSNGTVGEVFFAEEEISVDDNDSYFKIDGDDYYILKDSNEGLVWERVD